jgi:hypothetical protein
MSVLESAFLYFIARWAKTMSEVPKESKTGSDADSRRWNRSETGQFEGVFSSGTLLGLER